MTLQLLPSGCFEITLNDGSIIKGQFNHASLKKLSLMKGGLGYTETLDLLEPSITSGKDLVNNIIKLILFSVEGQYDDFDVVKWIEEMGGVGSEEWDRLNGHFLDGFVAKKKVAIEQT